MKNGICPFLYFLLIFLQSLSLADSPAVGIPFIKSYSAKDYGASSQNWAITQDNRGIIYFGNSNGILEYDGVSWRLIKTTDNSVVRSLAKDDQGKIYVGTFGDFGYLNPDSAGTLKYHSLKHKIPSEYHDFSDIWNIHITKEKVYFKSYKYLFELLNEKIKVIRPQKSEFNETHLYNDTLYVELWQIGLGKLIGDSVHMILTAEDFNGNYPGVGILLPYNDKYILIGNPNSGLFLFDGKKVKKFTNEVDDYLIENESYYGIKLENDRFAFSTINGGVITMNNRGELENIFNKATGLANNTVWQLFEDNEKSLWMATDNGISHVEYPSPITRFEENSEASGTINNILRFNKELYIATNNGLFNLERDQKKKKSNQFKIVEGLNEITWSLLPFENELLAGTNNGTYSVKNHVAQPIRKDNSVFLLKSDFFSSRIYIGLIDGIASMQFINGKWVDDGRIEGITEYIHNNIVETKNGDLWLGHYQGIIHVEFGEKFSHTPKIFKYNDENGLPSNNNNYVFSVAGNTHFATNEGLFKFDNEQKHFIPDSVFGSEFANGSRSVFILNEDSKGNIWMYSNNEIGILTKNKIGKFKWKNTPFLRLADFNIGSIYPDQNDLVWFSGSDGLFRYDPQTSKSYELKLSAIIRKIYTQNDSVIYGGFATNIQPVIPEYEYDFNAMRFEFSLPSYDNENANQFQYYLEGFDENWSQWTSESKATYTNIPEGRYRFRVKGRNIYNEISDEGIFAFKILPPWYRSWWAYLIYGFIIIGIVYVIIRLRSLKLEYEKKELEKIINERTDEIQVKNKQLEEQADKLQEMDEIKSRFFANISHELRTPLTLIKGPTEELVNDTYPGKKETALNSILINTNRMLRLINELLDLSKLESGSMKLNVSYQNLSDFIKFVVNSFKSLAESRNIHLHFISQVEEMNLYYDREKLEKILYNLLSNAFKFTPENGHITIALHKIKTDVFPQGSVEISVHDTGIGIPENEVEHIFNRFIQAHSSGNTRLEGSGIGLALSKELVELHGGQITVKSFVDEGTEFDVVLPFGREHLNEEEIIDLNKSEEFQTSKIQSDITDLKSEKHIGIINEQSGTSSEKCLVLIIEDHEEVRKYIKDHLDKNYDIIEADNGKSGLEISNERLPDLIVSDVMMPEIDGIELTETLKTNDLTKHIPIILLTAKASDEARIEGLETGADAYMSKPFNAKELEVRIKKLIEGRKNLRDKFKKEFLLEPSEINSISMDDDFIKRVHDKIEEKMADPDFNVEILLKDFALGQRQFTRKVIALTGHSPVQFIRIMRLKKAMNSIKQKAGTISQIAYDVGFSNLSYFSKSFQQQFGKLPSEI